MTESGMPDEKVGARYFAQPQPPKARGSLRCNSLVLLCLAVIFGSRGEADGSPRAGYGSSPCRRPGRLGRKARGRKATARRI